MGLVGDKLRAARKLKGMAIEEIAEITKIRAAYLEAIETGDYDRMPGEVFIKGWIKQYAQALGEDPRLCIDLYTEERHASQLALAEQQELQTEDEHAPPKAVLRVAEPGRRLRVALAVAGGVVSLLLIAVIILFGIRLASKMRHRPVTPSQTQTLTDSSSEQQQQPSAAVPPAASSAAMLKPGQTIPLDKSASPPQLAGSGQLLPPKSDPRTIILETNHDVWMRVRADGEIVFADLLEEDDSVEFTFHQRLEVHTGMAGHVEAFLDGVSLGQLGAGDEIADWSWPTSES